jgi:DNA-binding ferritin-like protein
MEIEIIPVQSQEDPVDPTRHFGIFLKKINTLIHMTHWYANDYQVHKILGKLYEDIDELFDTLQEEIIGTSRVQNVKFPMFVTDIDIDNIEQYKGTTQDIVNTFNKTNTIVQNILTSLEFNGYISSVKSGINNTRDDILTKFNRANYLLSLINI